MVRFAIPAALMFFGVSANASIIIIDSGGMGNPDENIVFNSVSSLGGTAGPGTTIQGATNQSQLLLDIMSGGPNILGEGGVGQATVSEENDNLFGADGIMFFNNDFDIITDLKFNLNASQAGTVTIDVLDNGDGLLETETFDLDEAGENFFRITGTDGMDFFKVTITTDGDILEDIKQIRISGSGDDGNTVVPEPASMMVWSFLAVAAIRATRRRRR